MSDDINDLLDYAKKHIDVAMRSDDVNTAHAAIGRAVYRLNQAFAQIMEDNK